MPKKNPHVALNEIKRLAKERGHVLLSEKYENFDSKLILFCQRHQKNSITTFGKYKKAKWGCDCCVQAVKKQPLSIETRKNISRKLKNKPKNSKSWLLGKTGPNHPSYKHGKGNVRADGSELELLKQWKKHVLHFYNYQCFLTGVTNTKKTPLVTI